MDFKSERVYLNVLVLLQSVTIVWILMARMFSNALLNWMLFVSIATLLFLSIRILVLSRKIQV